MIALYALPAAKLRDDRDPFSTTKLHREEVSLHQLLRSEPGTSVPLRKRSPTLRTFTARIIATLPDVCQDITTPVVIDALDDPERRPKPGVCKNSAYKSESEAA